jgi:hypothetical protein
MKRIVTAPLLWILLLALSAPAARKTQQDWTNYVRIGAYGLRSDNTDQIVMDAEQNHVSGIEVDNDIPGRYESFVNPEEKLNAIRVLAAKAHAVGNHSFVYIAGTECITANADKTPHTVAKEHPDWLQRKITGEPAVFGGGTAFWIAKGDEDVWISPYAPEWRKIYMERVRQVAATGIDGIYIDIPYWMTHFEGWEDSWASFDDYTVAAFKARTGLDAKKDMKRGDFSDPNFRKWVTFRIDTITDFLRDIGSNAKSVNPDIKIIPEIYPGIEPEAVRVGSDVYSLYPVVDAIAHEYEFGEGDHMASSRKPLDWFRYQVGMHTFRAFAEGKPTWILNYSWDGDQKVDKREAMMNLAMSQIMTGSNFWDAPGHSMAGSNDPETRKRIFSWIEAHERTFFLPRNPIHPIGVYFSPDTRNFYAKQFIDSYRGTLILLMQKHLEFQIVTPRTLNEFKGATLILPDVRVLSSEEKSWLATYVNGSNKLLIAGTDATELPSSQNVVRLAKDPGSAYDSALEGDFDRANPDQQQEFVKHLPPDTSVTIIAGPHVATSIASVGGSVQVFFANFDGLRGGVNPVQTPQSGVQVTVAQQSGASGYFLPFLGELQPVAGRTVNGRTSFTLPPITKGAVFLYGTNSGESAGAQSGK